MNELVSVDYCECGHMFRSHTETTWQDDDGNVVRFTNCTYVTCNCLQYRKNYTLIYENIFELNDE